MKIKINNKLIPLLAMSLFVIGCTSSRTFKYKFDDSNKQIIRYTLTNGKVGCENCYLNGACVQITDSVLTKDKYELTGKCALYSYHLIAESVNKGSEIKIKVKCALIVGRSKTNESYFLDEVAKALFDANQDFIKSQMSNVDGKQ